MSIGEHFNLPSNVTHAADTVSLGVIAGHFAGLLPGLATLGAVIWYGLQIWDWLERRRLRRHNHVPTPLEDDPSDE